MARDRKNMSRLEIIRENLNDFRKFLYDSNAGTVLGRGAKSWSKILVFYLFYYGFLAALFAASITIVLKTLDEYTPKYQTRVQTPALAIQPKMPSLVEQTSDVIFNVNDPSSYKKYVKVLDGFLEKYDSANQTNEDWFQDCGVNKPPMLNQEFQDGEIAKSCRFNRNRLGSCATGNYGFDEGKPCILVKLNRVINWFPVGYTDLSQATGQDDSNAPPLLDVLSAYENSYKPYMMYTACYGATDKDDKNLNGGVMTNTKYFPTDNGFPHGYYPYLGKKRQPGYVNPLVAVQFTNVTRDVEIKVNCKVYAKNIRDSKDQGEGFFSFFLQINQ